uniref:Activin_recp domain-containing protein n=1 Tax=Steinernema glaseri TaxID=37863 RepID=A0A1I7Y5T8_9BILA
MKDVTMQFESQKEESQTCYGSKVYLIDFKLNESYFYYIDLFRFGFSNYGTLFVLVNVFTKHLTSTKKDTLKIDLLEIVNDGSRTEFGRLEPVVLIEKLPQLGTFVEGHVKAAGRHEARKNVNGSHRLSSGSAVDGGHCCRVPFAMIVPATVVILTVFVHSSVALSCYEGRHTNNATQYRLAQDLIPSADMDLMKENCTRGETSCMRLEVGDQYVAGCSDPLMTQYLTNGARCDNETYHDKCTTLDSLLGDNSKFCCCSTDYCNKGVAAHTISVITVFSVMFIVLGLSM